MIGLGIVTALYKYAPWGPALAKTTGVVLLLTAIVLGVDQLAVGPHPGGH
jgi:hypothetical protein